MVRRSVKFGLIFVWVVLAMASPCAAKSLDLYPALSGFALRAPDAPQSSRPTAFYAQTGPNPAWAVSQWNIAGPRLSSFTTGQEGEQTIYTASAPAASVRIAENAAGADVTLQQNGAAVPCRTASGAPWESDLFLSSTSHAVGVIPGQPSGYLLSNLGALREVVTISVAAAPSTPAKSCTVNMGGAVLAIVLQDYTAQPPQTFFYQLHLNRYCGGQADGVCTTAWTRPLYYTRRNPYGCDDVLSRLGQPLLPNGTPRALDIDVLPGLRQAVASAPGGMDRDLAHWSVSGGYIGLISWGDVAVTSHWHGYRLVAETN